MLLSPYQFSWPNDFLKLKEIFISNIHTQDVIIEHVGSTSIENLSAKPIIDIDIAYEHNSTFYQIKADLEKIGYYHNGNQGIEGREVFKRNIVSKLNSILDSIPHHLYLCHFKNDEYIRHIVFRDYLRANTDARIEYERLKTSIAANSNHDKKQYALLKEDLAKPFVEKIISKAKLG
jgi:GrpB-like predicted nucleotidyltransferase (UPF0157 family)